MSCKGENFAYEGKCEEKKEETHCVCPAVYDPVCSENGTVYPNECELNCAGDNLLHKGECKNTCNCPFLEKPEFVCGVSGKTYWSECEMEC